MKKHLYNLGVASISFRKHTPREIIQTAQQAGLDCVEWGSDVHALCADSEALHNIATLQKEYGIFCSSYGTYFRLGETPLCDLEIYIAAAQTLGTTTLRLWCGSKSGVDMTVNERMLLVEQCYKAAVIAEKNAVTLCLECHGGTFTEKADDAVFLLHAVNSQCFKMNWQPFQWQSTEENLRYAKKIAPYTENLHVFNWKGEERFPLSQATAEWRAYLDRFSPRTLLLEFMPHNRIDELPAEAAALHRIVGENL